MRVWSEQEAEAQFDELLEACLVDGVQGLAREGVPVGVLVSFEELKRLEVEAGASLERLLSSGREAG